MMIQSGDTAVHMQEDGARHLDVLPFANSPGNNLPAIGAVYARLPSSFLPPESETASIATFLKGNRHG